MADNLAHAMDEVFSGEVETPQPDPAPAAQPAEPPAPEPAPQPEPPAPQPEAKPEEHSVPLAKALDWRDERNQLRKELDAYKAKEKAAPVPDPDDDPRGYAQHLEQKVQQQLTAQKFEMSDTIARQTHGGEIVEKAATWALEKAQNDPAFAAQYMREAHPIDWIVRQHKRDGLVSQLPNDISSLDELIEREIAKRSQAAPPAAPAAPAMSAPKPAAPPKSLVNAPSGGGVSEIPVGPLASVEAVFPR